MSRILLCLSVLLVAGLSAGHGEVGNADLKPLLQSVILEQDSNPDVDCDDETPPADATPIEVVAPPHALAPTDDIQHASGALTSHPFIRAPPSA